VNSRPKDFAEPPRWSASSLGAGEHACLDHRSECAARNGRRLPPPGDVSHPDAHPGYSSKTRSSSPQTSGRSLSGSAKSMPTFRNSTGWDKTSCRWSGNDKHAAWTPGWRGLTRVPRWNSGDLLLASRAITPPSKRPCPFHGGEAAGGGSDYAPKIPEKADVWARSLRAASLTRPTQSLIQAPHNVRMSRGRDPLDTEKGDLPTGCVYGLPTS
jgi:hypothetical protein